MRIKSLCIQRSRYVLRCTRWKNSITKFNSIAYVRHRLVGRQLFKCSMNFRCVKHYFFMCNVKMSNHRYFIFWNLPRYAIST